MSIFTSVPAVRGLALLVETRQVKQCQPGYRLEKAYCLAAVFKEALRQVESSTGLNIGMFTTDPDQDAIVKARKSLYPVNIAVKEPS